MLYQLEGYVLMGTFIVGGIFGRAAMQGVPSVEPITFFALLAGALFGWRKGAFVGASSWYLSNFFIFGGQGPWTLIHVLAGGVTGFLGSFLAKKPTVVKSILTIVLATAFFEITMNIASGFFFGWGVVVSFLSAIPFMAAHFISNIGFATILPTIKRFVHKTGRFQDADVCRMLIQKIKKRGAISE